MAHCYANVTAMNKNEQSTYQSYLLRLWRDSENSPWRASLQSTATEQIHLFADAGQLWAFLMAQLEGDGDDLAVNDALPHKTEKPQQSEE